MSGLRYHRIINCMAASLFVICIPLFLLSSHITWAVNSLPLYEYGFNKYDVSQNTGLSSEELHEVAISTIHFLNTGEQGEALDIFNDDEMAHLKEVSNLVHVNYYIEAAAFSYIVLSVAAGFAFKRRRFIPTLSGIGLYGCVITLMLIISLGVAALVDFGRFFSAFHSIFFTSETWMISGQLPLIFTEGFFADTTLFIFLAVIIECLIIGCVSYFLILRRNIGGLTAACGTGAGSA